MSLFTKNGKRQVAELSVSAIHPNPNQPRRYFDPESLNDLSRSIEQVGILQPLTVRRTQSGWELIAGERRLRAAEIAGLSTVPCLILDINDQSSSLLALIENIQRADLDVWEEAAALRQLIDEYHLSQEEAGQQVGISQSAVANKLRLLKLPADVIEQLRAANLTERHARALLSVPQGQIRPTYRHIVHAGLNVRAAEEYIAALNRGEVKLKPKKRKQKTKGFTRNMQIAVNSVNQCVEMITKMGIQATVETDDQDNELRMIIHLPK